MSAHENQTSERLVSAGEIAEMAGVGPSAVSNWRRRHTDFPAVAEENPAGDLFRHSEVVEWLRANGKRVRPTAGPVERTVRELANGIRGLVSPGDAPQILLQLLYLKSLSRGLIEGDPKYVDLWHNLSVSPEDPFDVWYRAVGGTGSGNDITARALRPSESIKGTSLRTLLHWFDRPDLALTPPGDLSAAILNEFVGSRGRFQENFTSSDLASIMIGLLEPIDGSVYDPACGSGMLLAAAWKNRSSDAVKLFGQELTEGSWRLGYLNLSLQGAKFDLRTGDTLQDDQFWSLRADRIALDPPLGLKTGARTTDAEDPRWTFGPPPKSNAELAWIQHLVFHLADDGIGAAIVSPGTLFRRPSQEADIRKGIIQSGLLDAVIQLPGGVLAGTSIPPALLLFDRGRGTRTTKVLFVDAVQLGRPERGGVRRFSSEDVKRILHTVQAWRNGSFSPKPQFSASETISNILEDGEAILSPNRYVTYALAESEIDGEPLEVRFHRILRTLSEDRHEVAGMVAGLPGRFSRWNLYGSETDFARVRLGDLLISQPRNGFRQTDEGPQAPVPFVATEDVSSGTPSLKSTPQSTTTNYKEDRLLRPGDLLLVSRGVEAGRRVGCATVRFNVPAAYSQSLIRLRIDPSRANPDFVRLFLKSRQGGKALLAVTSGSVISNLRPAALKEIAIPLPSIGEQNRIVNELLAIEATLSELEAYLELGRDTHDTLREGLASGVVSLKPEEPK